MSFLAPMASAAGKAASSVGSAVSGVVSGTSTNVSGGGRVANFLGGAQGMMQNGMVNPQSLGIGRPSAASNVAGISSATPVPGAVV